MKLKLLLSSFICFLFVNFFLAIYFNQIDKSSYTDWVSAFCNIVMAGATVSAVITARNYLAQFTAQEGYKIAISLINDDLLKLKSHFSIIVVCQSLQKKIDEHKEFLPRRSHLSLLESQIQKLNGEINDFSKYIYEVKLKIKKLHTYGLEVSRDKEVFFDNILNYCEKILEEAKDLRSKSIKINSFVDNQYKENKSRDYRYDSSDYPGGTLFTLERFESCIPNPFSVTDDIWNNLMKEHDLFFKKDNSITEIFKVKKAL